MKKYKEFLPLCLSCTKKKKGEKKKKERIEFDSLVVAFLPHYEAKKLFLIIRSHSQVIFQSLIKFKNQLKKEEKNVGIHKHQFCVFRSVIGFIGGFSALT